MTELYTRIMDLELAQEIVVREHYLHRRVHQLARPWAYGIFTKDYPEMKRFHRKQPPRFHYEEEPLAVFIFGIPHFNKLKGVFGVEGVPDKWQTLMNFRNYVSPKLREIQGDKYSVSQHLAPIFKRLEVDYIDQFGVVDPAKPWRITQVVSYSDEHEGHRGTMYKAMGFVEVGKTRSAYKSNPGGSSGRHEGGLVSETGRAHKTCWVLQLPKKRPTPEMWLFEMKKKSTNREPEATQLALF